MASNSRGHATRRQENQTLGTDSHLFAELGYQSIAATNRRPDRRKRVQELHHETSHSIEASLSTQIQDINYCVPLDLPGNQQMQLNTTNEVNKNRRKKRKRKLKPGETAALSGQDVPSASHLLAAPTYCQYCSAKKFQYEPPGFCCSSGEVKIATNPCPPELDSLFTSNNAISKDYHKFSRLFNNFFAFSSLGGKIDCKKKKGIYVFKLHGQIYHFLPDLVPSNNNPKYLQLYFYDSHLEHETRAGIFKELDPEIISILMKVMDSNPYARFFRHLSQMQVQDDTTIHINKNAALDQRVYNAPSANEVAVIWPDRNVADTNTTPHIVVHGKSDTPHRIKHYYGCYDPLQYPLLFPRGESGWHPGIPRFRRKDSITTAASSSNATQTAPVNDAATIEELIAAEDRVASKNANNKKRDISCREYYAYMLQIRKGNRILASGRVLLQFIVDMYVKLENTRLDFFRNNQSTIRADLYQGIVDSILLGELRGANAGHRIVLPPSFIGGPRDMKRRYLNAMQLVQRFGKPDVFATMTCNTNWPEIKAELADGEEAQNRPDVVARIFRAKLLEVKKQIMEDKIFGEVAAFIYVIEFQKRGLPHAHCLIILEPPFKIKCPEDFDKFVSAEIPPPSMPHLRAIVLNHMMHGPCGAVNPLCPCMKEKNGKRSCKSSYPKAFSEFTTNKDDGYPTYKRQDTGEKIRIRGHDMDNRWVIPYNPYLLAMFDCHFNVEICSTIQAVKYLYKYVYKGHDRVAFNIGHANDDSVVDEISNFQSGRWVSAPEAAWRIFGFDMYEMYPPVMPLNIHCENGQRVPFGPHENLSNVISDPVRLQTPLTEFFKLNAERPDGPKYLYIEFPEYFVWNDKAKMWSDRKKGKTIGRLTFVNPSEGDRYYLRILLANVRAPTSFDDLKTVDGHKYASFQEACLQRKLIEQSNMTEQCLDEAVQFQMPAALRNLFVTLLIFCRPPNPTLLWEQYFNPLSEDFRNAHPNDPERVLALTAEQIEQLLENMGKTLNEFGLQHLKDVQQPALRLTREIRDAINAPLPERYIHAKDTLNAKQQEAYNCIMDYVRDKKPGAFFIDGPGGTGKTYLYSALYGTVRHLGKIVLTTASSGIAATELPNGRTAHSRFKLPIDHDSSLTCDVPKQGSLAALLKETTLIIWDEAPMANKASIHALDLLLRDLCNPDILFGGKIVVLGGDFRQVLPVVPHKTQKEAVEASLVSSELWPHFKRFHLTENMRAREDAAFSTFLLQLGDGKLQQQEQALITLPDTIAVTSFDADNGTSTLVKDFMPPNSELLQDSSVFTSRAILTPKNDEVDTLNKAFIEIFEGESVTYKSYDSLLDETEGIYPPEFLNTLCPGGMSPHELTLKQDAPVILLRNIGPAKGECNGTRMTCKSFSPNMILCQIATGFHAGEDVFVPRIKLRPSASSHFPFQFQRKQFPIKLSFAMTINKSQGQTLNEVAVYLKQPCFSHGQLYVALSRARKASKVTVITPATTTDEQNCNVRNIVSFEILKRAGII